MTTFKSTAEAKPAVGKEAYDPTKPFNSQIRELICATHPRQGPLTVVDAGKRASIERDPRYSNYWNDLRELDSTDGTGTKGLLHFLMRTEQYAAQDAFAMVADDLAERNFTMVKMLDHIQMQEEDPARLFRIVGALVKLAMENAWKGPDGKHYPIIMTGGETAIINTIQGFEVSVMGTGYVTKGEEIEANARPGDSIIGIGSSGVHSNGLTFLRDEFFKKHKMALDQRLPWGPTVGEELTRPTSVYLPALKEMIAYAVKTRHNVNDAIHGQVHITGGGLSKLHELMQKGGHWKVDITVGRDHSLETQPLFRYVHDSFGVPSEKMYTRFNNGVGYAIAVAQDFEDDALKTIRRRFPADVIGHVKRGSGKVAIESQYDKGVVEYP
jgi:phosphoribosylformylglycinamidine cyclo-ligase